MEYLEISTDSTMRELAVHGSEEYPIKLYVDSFSDYRNGIMEWHWHDEIEILYIARGAVKVLIGGDVIQLTEGEGVFINSRVIHKFKSDNLAEMPNTLFLPEFIAPKDSLIYNKYIFPLIHSGDDAVKLSPDVPWQRETLYLLKSLYNESKDELAVHIVMEKIWSLLYENIPTALEHKKNSAQTRVRRMMTFISEKYNEKITLEDIAKAADISKSEALRCFRICLDTTPVGYLIDYRLSKAAGDILAGGVNVTQIAFANGFESVGYFGKRFRRKYGVSPKEYREIKTENRFYRS